jgi:hypothetical protein
VNKENAMSCVQYENFQVEEKPATRETKTFTIATKRAKSVDPVAEALNLVLANGSMPA